MLKFIQNLFGETDTLSEAGQAGNSQELARLFLEKEVILLSLPIVQSLDPANMTEEELLKLNNLKSYTIKRGQELKVFKQQ